MDTVKPITVLSCSVNAKYGAAKINGLGLGLSNTNLSSHTCEFFKRGFVSRVRLQKKYERNYFFGEGGSNVGYFKCQMPSIERRMLWVSVSFARDRMKKQPGK